MVARPRSRPDLQKRPPFGAERADPASPAGLSVGTWERNGTKTQSKRQFLDLSVSNNVATLLREIPTARVRDRSASSDHWGELEVPMRRLTAQLSARPARCVAEIPPSRPRGRVFFTSFPHEGAAQKCNF